MVDGTNRSTGKFSWDNKGMNFTDNQNKSVCQKSEWDLFHGWLLCWNNSGFHTNFNKGKIHGFPLLWKIMEKLWIHTHIVHMRGKLKWFPVGKFSMSGWSPAGGSKQPHGHDDTGGSTNIPWYSVIVIPVVSHEYPYENHIKPWYTIILNHVTPYKTIKNHVKPC